MLSSSHVVFSVQIDKGKLQEADKAMTEDQHASGTKTFGNDA